ncbi:hypothetical protein F4801DRAFT_492007 [Xylaria longipes]|nr:hypothetical protein F4801DRAFT_492007 [Xylaria longipes]
MEFNSRTYTLFCIDEAIYHNPFGALVGEGYITKVSVGGREMCCKSGDDDCLRKVARSHLARSIRVPRLRGLVTSVEMGVIIGVLSLDSHMAETTLSLRMDKQLKGHRNEVDTRYLMRDGVGFPLEKTYKGIVLCGRLEDGKLQP